MEVELDEVDGFVSGGCSSLAMAGRGGGNDGIDGEKRGKEREGRDKAARRLKSVCEMTNCKISKGVHHTPRALSVCF